MKKHISTTEGKADTTEALRKLKKYVSEAVRRVDLNIGTVGSIGTLFVPQLVSSRGKLRDLCERAILVAINGSISPQPFEDILWKKIYYDPYSTAKKLRKDNTWSLPEAALIWGHLNDGIAYYHHLLHSYYMTNPTNQYSLDFLPIHYHNDEANSTSSNCAWYKDSILRALTCLGDLARYTLDLPKLSSNPLAYLLPIRYYHQYLSYNCESGLIHSNLAHIYSTNDKPLLAAIHYLRSLTCEKPFEAADHNLKKMLDASNQWLNKRISTTINSQKIKGYNNKTNSQFLHTCLCLVLSLISNDSTEHVSSLCQDVLYQLGNLLENYDDPNNLEAGDGGLNSNNLINDHFDGDPIRSNVPLHNNNNNNENSSHKSLFNQFENDSFKLNPESMTIISGLFIVCVQRLKSKGSAHMNMAEVFLVSVLLTLINHVNERLEQRISLIDPTALDKLLPTEEKNETDKNQENNLDKSEQKKSDKKSNVGKLSRIRRRRITKHKMDSDSSEDEDDVESVGSDEEDIDNDESEHSDVIQDEEEENEDAEIDMSQLCSSEDDDSDYDIKIESDQEWDGLTTKEHLQLISQEEMLSSIFVICNWLISSESVLTACIKTADSFWTALARLLNLIHVDINNILTENQSYTRKEVIELMKFYKDNILKVEDKADKDTTLSKSKLELASSFQKTPLPEDVLLSSVIPCHINHSLKSLNIRGIEIELLRLMRLEEFGINLSKRMDCPLWFNPNGFTFDKEKCTVVTPVVETSTPVEQASETKKIYSKKQFSAAMNSSVNNDSNESDSKANDNRLEGMQSLTKQWLQHEVQNLEERTSRKATVGLYLIPDAAVLINHLPFMKFLLTKPTHMIIIPQIVIDSLDQLKKESIGARDAIRWLEVIFRHGSRFLRAQRSHERTHLPLIKYPKRKEKEAWNWYQIVECCHYLGAQVQHGKKNKTSTVTLLTGESVQSLSEFSFSPSGITQAAGAILEHIDDFKQKWKTSTKGHS